MCIGICIGICVLVYVLVCVLVCVYWYMYWYVYWYMCIGTCVLVCVNARKGLNLQDAGVQDFKAEHTTGEMSRLVLSYYLLGAGDSSAEGGLMLAQAVDDARVGCHLHCAVLTWGLLLQHCLIYAWTPSNPHA